MFGNDGLNQHRKEHIEMHELTMTELYQQAALEAIQSGTDFAHSVADELCQIFDNVRHMSWFHEEVAARLALA